MSFQLLIRFELTAYKYCCQVMSFVNSSRSRFKRRLNTMCAVEASKEEGCRLKILQQDVSMPKIISRIQESSLETLQENISNWGCASTSQKRKAIRPPIASRDGMQISYISCGKISSSSVLKVCHDPTYFRKHVRPSVAVSQILRSVLEPLPI